MEWSVILDITIILLLLFDILLYGVMRNQLKGVIAILGYTYMYLKLKDDDFHPDEEEED